LSLLNTVFHKFIASMNFGQMLKEYTQYTTHKMLILIMVCNKWCQKFIIDCCYLLLSASFLIVTKYHYNTRVNLLPRSYLVVILCRNFFARFFMDLCLSFSDTILGWVLLLGAFTICFRLKFSWKTKRKIFPKYKG
jgi:hypothetical protein